MLLPSGARFDAGLKPAIFGGGGIDLLLEEFFAVVGGYFHTPIAAGILPNDKVQLPVFAGRDGEVNPA